LSRRFLRVEKIYLDFFILEKIAKKPKIHISGSTAKMGSMAGTFTIPEFN
jgi:hypothetical protein